jgi:RNA polymerase-binding protein DksA
MLRALPVVKISAREPDMAGTASAGKGKTPSSETTRRTRASASAKTSKASKSKSKSASAAKSAGSTTSPAAQKRRRKTGTSAVDKAGRLPVRAGEERWTADELASVRATLSDENTELQAEITRAESQIADRLGDTSEGAGDDQADAGAKTYEREHELALTYNARELLAQNERALNRIETGTYGVCESCGNPIGKARLQAFPRATLCVTCKQREERR